MIEYPSEEKLMQLKSQQQLYVSLLRNSMQSLYEHKRGTSTLKDSGNMNQMLFPFVMDDNRTYEKTGVDEVGIVSG